MDPSSLDAIVGLGDQPLVLFDRFGEVVYANEAFTALGRFDRGGPVGRRGPILEPPILVARAVDRTWAIPTGRVWLRCGDETRDQVWVDALPMRIDGQMFHLCTVRPTSVEVEAPSVGLDDARLRELLANLPGGVYRCSYDRHWRTIFMSERFADICGCPSAEFLEPYGRSFKEIVVEEDVPIIQAAVRRAIVERSFYEIEFRIARPDGTVRWLLDRGMPVADSKGVVRWLDGAMFDITAQKEAEERAAALESERAAAEAASAAKTRFLAVMSHEMRTPLNAIVGMTTLLADSTLDDEQRAYVETARTSTDALLDLINDVLDFSKIDTGHTELVAVDFDVIECVSSAMELLRPRAVAKGLRFAATVGDEVPRWLKGDPGRLRQVLVNLVGNAVKFTDGGEVVCAVSGAVEGDRARLQISVRDTGIGIPAERQQAIFEAFQQVDPSSTRRYEGSGLGLAISKRLVTLMGSELHLRSAPGQGSTFWFEVCLPVGRAAEPSTGPAPGAELPRLRILLAEDNPINQRVGLRLLEMLGLDADVAADGVETLAALHRAEYDLVLMDVRMPELDGLEATRRLRSTLPADRQPRVVALTANATREDEAACFEAGMDAFLSKPLRVSALESTLHRLFDDPARDEGVAQGEQGRGRARA